MRASSIKYALIMFAGFIAFFFSMKAAGLYTELWMRGLNVAIHATLVYLAMNAYRKQEHENFKYLDTFGVGFRTGILGVALFALFQFFYLGFIDPEFMTYIQENAVLGSMLTPFLASLFLAFEGFSVTILTAYIGMRVLEVKEESKRGAMYTPGYRVKYEDS